MEMYKEGVSYLLTNLLGRVPKEEEVERCMSVFESYAPKLNQIYDNYTKKRYRGEALAGMVWVYVNYKGEVLEVGADEKLSDRDILFKAIGCAVNEAFKVTREARVQYRNEIDSHQVLMINDLQQFFLEQTDTQINIDKKSLLN
jgi:DNA-binding protein YbaB